MVNWNFISGLLYTPSKLALKSLHATFISKVKLTLNGSYLDYLMYHSNYVSDTESGPKLWLPKNKKKQKTKSVQTLKSLEVRLVPFPTMYKC